MIGMRISASANSASKSRPLTPGSLISRTRQLATSGILICANSRAEPNNSTRKPTDRKRLLRVARTATSSSMTKTIRSGAPAGVSSDFGRPVTACPLDAMAMPAQRCRGNVARLNSRNSRSGYAPFAERPGLSDETRLEHFAGKSAIRLQPQWGLMDALPWTADAWGLQTPASGEALWPPNLHPPAGDADQFGQRALWRRRRPVIPGSYATHGRNQEAERGR